MASHTHEAIAELLCDSPLLVADLLGRCFGVQLPPFATATRADAKLTELSISEYRSDGVLGFQDGSGVVVASVVLEVQLRRDPDKHWVWPVYLSLTRARHRCPTILLVVTIDEPTADWARTEIDLGGGNLFRPLVLGPAEVPKVEDVSVAAANPELAVLSALAHSKVPEDATVVRAVLAGISGAPLEGTRFAYYRDVIEQSLSAAVRRALEAQMPYPGYEPQSEVSKAIYRGLAEGKAEGQVIGLRSGLFRVLAARKLTLREEQRERIEACTDLALLNEWLDRAVIVSDAEELFASSPD